jgi:hypothetical protein
MANTLLTNLVAPAASGLVTVSGTQTLTNKTLTSPVISTIVNVGTLTIPAVTDTLVGRATTDSLTNKTLSSVVLTGTVTAGGGTGTSGQVLSSTGTGVEWVDQTGGGGGGGVGGYTNSTLTSFPSGNYNGTDTYVGESSTADAFGVSLLAIFTCMDPVGSTQTTDLGVLT